MPSICFHPSAGREKYARHIESSAGVAVWIAERQGRHWVAVGRAFQRFALTATSLGLKHAHINQPVEVASLRPQLASLLGLPTSRRTSWCASATVRRFVLTRRPMSSVMQMGARGPVAQSASGTSLAPVTVGAGSMLHGPDAGH